MKLQRGLTLVELAISIAVIGVALTGVFLAINTSFLATVQPDRQVQAVAIAEAYLEEIRLQAFSDPDGAAEASRDLFDDIWDYDGLSEAPTDQTGTPIADLDAYQVQVSVVNSAVLGPAAAQVPNAAAARIDVRVTRGNEIDFTLSTHRTDH